MQLEKSHSQFPLLCLVAIGLIAVAAQASEPAPQRSQANFEVRFLTGMIDHHSMAIGMAMLCEGRATHEELLALCTSIIESQSAEVELMQSWLADWYGVSHEPDMKRRNARTLAELAELSGADFEISFLEMMIEHHEGAIEEATKCQRRAFHAELHELCDSIIQAQSAEIELMEDWLSRWYGR